MPNVTTTHLDPRTVALGPVDGVEALIAFAGVDTFAKGTILGRKSTSADSYAGVIVGTGSKTIALTARAGRSLKPGAYVLTVGDVTTGAGPATLVDPNGISEAVTLAASGAHQFVNLGVTMTITAGGTELDDAATVTFTVTEPTGKPVFAPYSPTGSNGLENPTAVLLDEVSATGAGNVPARPVIRGDLNRNMLVVDGGTVTESVIEKLRINGLFARSTTELGVYDNTAPTP